MPTMEALLELIGQPVKADAVQLAIASDSLVAHNDSDIAGGIMGRSYLTSHDAGYELMCVEGRIDTAFIYLIPTGAFRPFPGHLLAGLSSDSTREDVRQKLGPPSRSGGTMIVPGLGRQGPWDRYDAGHV